jgi:uncharacterized membrane protein YdbT with pleckstrin-like domain
MPDQAKFPGQRPDEDLVFKERRHWFVLLVWLGPPLLLLALMLGVALGIGLALQPTTLWWALITLALITVPVALVIWRALDWENDHYILTTQRIMHIERVYFLFESRDEAALGKIQDVTVQMPTLTSNLLYFGDVVIETAGTTGRIKFEAVPKPRKVQRLIFREAGLPEPGTTRQEETWQPSRSRLFRPLETMTRMLYPVVPRGGGVKVWRKHWFILLSKIMTPTALAVLLLTVWVIVLVMPIPPDLRLISEFTLQLIPGILFMIDLAWVVWSVIDWHNDLYVLTPTHVIDIEKRPFTQEFRREANLRMIQNVSYEQPSFISKLLDFGNTRLETAGTTGEFTFDSVPNPRKVQETIFQQLEAVRQPGVTAPRTREELEEAFRQLLRDEYNLSPGGAGGSSASSTPPP